MTIHYLLDTNVLSEPLRPRPNNSVLDMLKKTREECATAAIVWHELLTGCERLPKSARRKALESYLFEVVAASMLILPYDSDAAAWHAVERARLMNAGKTAPFADGQIAAIASTNSLTLVTFNTVDYKSFKGLLLADWRSS